MSWVFLGIAFWIIFIIVLAIYYWKTTRCLLCDNV